MVLAYVFQCMRLVRGCFQWIVDQILGILRGRGEILRLDTGRQVRVGKQLAEGGYSFVFEATDAAASSSSSSSSKKRKNQYALKRILCPEREMLEACKREVSVHRSVSHYHLMPLLGFTVTDDAPTMCYMLFPYMPSSLRSVVHSRTLDMPQNMTCAVADTTSPWQEVVVLQIFLRLCRGVLALHTQGGYSHRDIKLDNILLPSPTSRHPVLMDFGSAGPLEETVDSRRQVLRMTEVASMHTTISYRPPELFEGGIRPGDAPVDFKKVDVWSLGCTLFAMMFGTSPFEMEFGRAYGQVRITECTQLSVLKPVPRPPAQTATASWYSEDLHELVAFMLVQDRKARPDLPAVLEKVQSLLSQRGVHASIAVDARDGSDFEASAFGWSEDDDDEEDGQGSDGIALMTRNRVL